MYSSVTAPLLLILLLKNRVDIGRWGGVRYRKCLVGCSAERMKMSSEKKRDRHNAHDVPLSRQVLALLDELRPMSFGSGTYSLE